jgi:hypothetical protein
MNISVAARLCQNSGTFTHEQMSHTFNYVSTTCHSEAALTEISFVWMNLHRAYYPVP